MAIRTVYQGECVYSIAAESRLHWETIWAAPENAELRRRRKNPGILLPGDEIFIPNPTEKVELATPEQVNRFRIRDTAARLRVRFATEGRPWADEVYFLDVGRMSLAGTLDADGVLDVRIPAGVPEARIRFRDRDPILLQIGSLDPADTWGGAAGRLRNLGWLGAQEDQWGGEDAVADVATALAGFQAQYGLEVTGKLDDATAARLTELHGS